MRKGSVRKGAVRLPAMWFVTDPERTPDPVALATRLPRGAGVIFRGFGRPDAESTAQALAALARRRGLILLIGFDAALASRIGAAGVHLPEREMARAARLKARHPNWIVTAAAHSPRAVRRAAAMGVDAVLLSTAFASRSASAGRPLGPLRLAAIVRGASVPVIALGGVNGATARRLVGTGVAGVAGVEAFTG